MDTIMNHLEKFNETVGILVKAYLEGTLIATSCAACAVGNLVVHANDFRMSRFNNCTYWNDGLDDMRLTNWQDVVWNINRPDVWTKEGIREVESTGYTAKELHRIEHVFMKAQCIEGDNYDGLMAVVDCLADIHGIDLAAATASKALFVKA